MSYIKVNLMGGLGNCLFQIATAYSTSIRDNKEFFCNLNTLPNVHRPIQSYFINILRNVPFNSKNDYEYVFPEKEFYYSPIPKIDNNINLIGYFQSEKYFMENRDKILNLFKIDNETNEFLIQKYGDFLNENTCSIHVRRGDYIKLEDYHAVIPLQYYRDAVNIIGYDSLFLIFSDDIEWCKKNLNFIKNKIFISDNMDYQDLYLMSMCKNNIIANSTFSWWGTWLNQNQNKKVIAPRKWFGIKNRHLDTKDLYCEQWQII